MSPEIHHKLERGRQGILTAIEGCRAEARRRFEFAKQAQRKSLRREHLKVGRECLVAARQGAIIFGTDELVYAIDEELKAAGITS